MSDFNPRKIITNLTKEEFKEWCLENKENLQYYIDSLSDSNYDEFQKWIISQYDLRTWNTLIDSMGNPTCKRPSGSLSYKYLVGKPTINGATIVDDIELENGMGITIEAPVVDTVNKTTKIKIAADVDMLAESTATVLAAQGVVPVIASEEQASEAPELKSIKIGDTLYAIPTGGEGEVTQQYVDNKVKAEEDRAIARENEIESKIPSVEQYATKQELNDEAQRATSEEARIEGLIPDVSDLAKKSEIPTKTSQLTNDSGFLTEHQSLSNYYTKDETYNRSEVDAKIATGTGLYLGWLQNDAETIPSESEIGTWIVNNWSSLQPQSVEKVTNNDYIFIYFSTQYVYWRVKVVTEETGKVLPSEVTWKKDLEFNDDIIGLVQQVEANRVAITNETTRATTRENEIEAKIPTKTSQLTNDSGFLTQHQDISGKLDATKCTYQTTSPTAEATDGGIHIVYLTAEPTAYYDGYIYLIKEA